ncbi:MAG: sporulation histidine kinase inhibitor Sda [Bacillota bacterium]
MSIGLKLLNNVELIEIYKIVMNGKFDNDFYEIIKDEISKRKLKLNNHSTP